MPKFRPAFFLATFIVVAASVLAVGAAVVSSPPQPIFNVVTRDLPKTPSANVRVFVGSLAPGEATFWHVHSSPPIVYVESGAGTWEYRSGRKPDTRRAGQVMLEPANIAVRLFNHGTTVVKVVMFSVSKVGEPFMRPAQ